MRLELWYAGTDGHLVLQVRDVAHEAPDLLHLLEVSGQARREDDDRSDFGTDGLEIDRHHLLGVATIQTIAVAGESDAGVCGRGRVEADDLAEAALEVVRDSSDVKIGSYVRS